MDRTVNSLSAEEVNHGEREQNKLVNTFVNKHKRRLSPATISRQARKLYQRDFKP